MKRGEREEGEGEDTKLKNKKNEKYISNYTSTGSENEKRCQHRNIISSDGEKRDDVDDTTNSTGYNTKYSDNASGITVTTTHTTKITRNDTEETEEDAETVILPSSTKGGKRKRKRHLVATSDGTKIHIFDVNNFLKDIDAPADCPHLKDVNVPNELTTLKCYGHFGENCTSTTLSDTLRLGNEQICGSGCLVCCDKTESWLCLHCMRVFCGRYVQEHSAMHAKNSKHHIAMSLKGLSFWCYTCDRYLEHSFNTKLHDLYTSAHRIKFPDLKKPPLDPFAKLLVSSPRKAMPTAATSPLMTPFAAATTSTTTTPKLQRQTVLERQHSLLGGRGILVHSFNSPSEDSEFDADTFDWENDPKK